MTNTNDHLRDVSKIQISWFGSSLGFDYEFNIERVPGKVLYVSADSEHYVVHQFVTTEEFRVYVVVCVTSHKTRTSFGFATISISSQVFPFV